MTLSKISRRLCSSTYLSMNLGINLIISRIPHGISKILFALGADDFLALLEGKIKECHLFKVQSGKTTVCCFNMRHLVLNELLLIIFNDSDNVFKSIGLFFEI